ncbi:MAG: phosphoserine phosphatase SerB [Bosea sp. (in: a-proteobacteria)]|uniref:phosphoserine phosphatase SerB n=1 Tax=Bosea sp. (in: a-proteobacteria) TaxID=1871050 RepID=UPI002734C3DA|nr:phosphoserine phosphatase SerB [Bosea sp. (in: a-proteobacteria)]MDP3256148.1 phosphoserine phosphatase SerB [Bosea sp. (in: a-proteobacteria)]MDP3321250.1 phosphoserine phosphatase SerB [Bosea sp. (in: a-proteobacteria)]
MLVATLVSAHGQALLDEGLLKRLAALPGALRTQRLDGEIAADLFAEAADARKLEADLRPVLDGAQIDIMVQPAATRRKALFLADMDSTMIGQECIDELAAYVGLKEKVSGITERAMRGEIAFEPALRERVALLKGVPLSVVDEIIRERITLTPGGRELVMTMRRQGGYTALVSGGFTVFTGPIGTTIGFDEHRSNTLLAQDGVLIGEVADPILGKQAKLDALLALRARLGLTPAQTLAVGDGANDLAMLGEAGLGVAFRAKPAVAAAAHARLDHADLTAMLYAQGYTGAEIVRA